MARSDEAARAAGRLPEESEKQTWLASPQPPGFPPNQRTQKCLGLRGLGVLGLGSLESRQGYLRIPRPPAEPRALWWGQAPLPEAPPHAPRRPSLCLGAGELAAAQIRLDPRRDLGGALPALGTPTPGGPDAPRSSPEESPRTPDLPLALKPPPFAPLPASFLSPALQMAFPHQKLNSKCGLERLGTGWRGTDSFTLFSSCECCTVACGLLIPEV